LQEIEGRIEIWLGIAGEEISARGGGREAEVPDKDAH